MATIDVASSETIGSAYQWTESGSGTDEWYLELSGGGDPDLNTTDFSATYNGVALTEDTLGSLAAGEYALEAKNTES